uniref:Major facilitator superfamily (MFS) profile domain-containing protein n=1 Tax=Amphiprion ocellaris TaxID=80972 RepID=A0AAQ5YDJ3_AMPOC
LLWRAGSIVAPLLNMLSVYHWAIPISILSSFTIISGALGLLLPETRNKELPETASDAEGNRYASSKQVNLGQLLTPLSKP